MPRQPPRMSRKSETSMPSRKPEMGDARMSETDAAVTSGMNWASTMVASPTRTVMTIRMV